MSGTKTEIETYFGRCRCCLSYGYLKNMWSEHQHKGVSEVYGEMLIQCFALSWNHTESSMEEDQICEQCVVHLRDATNFKKLVLDSQEEIMQQIDADVTIKVENDTKYEVPVYNNSDVEDDTADPTYTAEYGDTGDESDPGDDSNSADYGDSVDYGDTADDSQQMKYEMEYEEVEYLEEDDAGDEGFKKVDTDYLPPPLTQSRPVRRSRRPKQPKEETDDGAPKRKWPKKLPKSERFKTYRQYTEEAMRRCLEEVRKGAMTPLEASKKYNVPKKTICAKLKTEPKDVQIDNTTKSTKKHKLDKFNKRLKKKPTIFVDRAIIDKKTKDIIQLNKLMAKKLKFIEHKVCTKEKHDGKETDKITIEIKPKDAETQGPINADQVRTLYKAIVNEKFKKESKEPEKFDPSEIIKHRDNVKTILKNSNATIIKGYWGTGYSCNFCDEQRSIASQLKQHNLEAHTNIGDDAVKVKYVSDLVIRLDITDLKCKLCEKAIDTLEEFMEHLSKTHSQMIHTDIKNHIIPFKFNTDLLQCIKCNKEFKYFKLLSEHMSEHYRNYECSLCDRAFINKQSMQTHSYRHKRGVFKCTHCPKVFDTRPKRSVHERVVHALSNKTRKCTFCDERFSTKDLVQSHEVKVHGVTPVVFSCQACNKTYHTQSSLITHTNRYHLLMRPHKCSYCDMSFFSKIELRSHTVTHTRSRDFKCELCNKAFGTRCSLNQHVRGHLDHRKYKCDHCDRAFVHRTSWKVHLRSKHAKIV